jgi:hypothetical protein
LLVFCTELLHFLVREKCYPLKVLICA